MISLSWCNPRIAFCHHQGMMVIADMRGQQERESPCYWKGWSFPHFSKHFRSAISPTPTKRVKNGASACISSRFLTDTTSSHLCSVSELQVQHQPSLMEGQEHQGGVLAGFVRFHVCLQDWKSLFWTDCSWNIVLEDGAETHLYLVPA